MFIRLEAKVACERVTMYASRCSALGPRVVAIALIALATASCSSDSGRLPDIFGSDNNSSAKRPARSRRARTGGVESRPDAAPCRPQRRGHLGWRPRHGVVPAGQTRKPPGRSLTGVAAADLTWEGGKADRRGAGRATLESIAAPWRACRRHHGGEQHHQPGDGASRRASRDPASPAAPAATASAPRPGSRRTRTCDPSTVPRRSAAQCAGGGFRHPRRGARARPSTASRGFTVSR